MQKALERYLSALARGGEHRAAVRAAAEVAAADGPWRVVEIGGVLARARLEAATTDLGLTPTLAVVSIDDARAVVRVDQGQPYPTLDPAGRRRRGAYDTPRDLARRVAREAIRAAASARRGLDPSCGAGAFLVAMAEAGVNELLGTDLDPVVVEVARVACPRARITVADALEPGELADVVCGNPPFVRPERQDRSLRAALRARFSWLGGRFDLGVPFAALAADRVDAGGAVGLVLPYSMLAQPYAAGLRRRWLTTFRVRELAGPLSFAGVHVDVGIVVLARGRGEPSTWPALAALRLDNAPMWPGLVDGDVEIVEQMEARSEPLGMLCEVDTGVVAHGPSGPKARLIRVTRSPETVPYADAREFFAGRSRWLRYRPAEMHRPKRPELFDDDKIVIQRLRGRGPVRAAVDRSGIYVGHTCTVARPWGPGLDLDRLVELIRSALVDGYTRIRSGARLDLYPRDVRAIPVPSRWLVDPTADLAEAYGLDAGSVDRLVAIARGQ